jgi:hypothetical protein
MVTYLVAAIENLHPRVIIVAGTVRRALIRVEVGLCVRIACWTSVLKRWELNWDKHIRHKLRTSAFMPQSIAPRKEHVSRTATIARQRISHKTTAWVLWRWWVSRDKSEWRAVRSEFSQSHRSFKTSTCSCQMLALPCWLHSMKQSTGRSLSHWRRRGRSSNTWCCKCEKWPMSLRIRRSPAKMATQI